MAAFNNKAVPAPPYKVPYVDSKGFLTKPWADFVRQVYVRIGSAEAMSNTELEGFQSDELVALQASVASLTSTIASLSATTTVLLGLDQGRSL